MYVYVYLLKVILLSWKIRPNYEEREREWVRERRFPIKSSKDAFHSPLSLSSISSFVKINYTLFYLNSQFISN